MLLGTIQIDKHTPVMTFWSITYCETDHGDGYSKSSLNLILVTHHLWVSLTVDLWTMTVSIHCSNSLHRAVSDYIGLVTSAPVLHTSSFSFSFTGVHWSHFNLIHLSLLVNFFLCINRREIEEQWLGHLQSASSFLRPDHLENHFFAICAHSEQGTNDWLLPICSTFCSR
jgi:hypothetical protein